MRTKHGKLEDSNYWPGYVDALVNVVLNMLFMVGIMAVGLVCLNLEALSNFKLARQAQQLYQINEENMMLAALGMFMAALPDVNKPAEVKPVVRPEPARIEPVRPPSSLRVGHAQASTALADERQQISERMQWNDHGPIGVLGFEPFAFQLSAAQSQQIRQAVAQGHAGRWHLAVAVDGDERAVREAFWRLTEVRQELLAAGVPQASITLRTVNMLTPSVGSSRRIFMTQARVP
jgi:hypothetical protein